MWLNFIGLLLLISILEPLLIKSLFPEPEKQITATFISLFITRLIIFPWQFIGLIRATDEDYLVHGHTIKTRSIQALILLSIVFNMTYSIELIQKAKFNQQQAQISIQDTEKAKYTLAIKNNAQQLVISGDIEIGITQAVEELIQKNTDISSIILESKGGQIYEGRGLSKLFTKYQLDTYSYDECSSACATAFIGGKHRYLGKSGKLGFHQYKQDTKRYPKAVPFHVHDLVQEQKQDLEIFKQQGISQQFLDKVFDQPADGIWFPDHSELIKAGVIHRTIN